VLKVPDDSTETWPTGDVHYLEPPPEEPVGDNLLDPNDLRADDCLWEDFYALPTVLAHDPTKDWDLALT